MKTFAQFIVEVERKPIRALKLADNLLVRQNSNPKDKYASIGLKHPHKDEGNKLANTFRNSDYAKSFSHPGAAYYSHAPVDLPIDKLHATQQSVSHTRKITKSKFSDSEPINVIHHEGKHYIMNGHHRVFASRLLGKKTIKAHVIDSSKFIKEKE